jgi:hypothetical protein
MPSGLRTYFNGIANTLASRAETAGVFSGRGDIGRCREIVAEEFFRKHLPPRFTVGLGGEIFGLPDKRSGQIDLIVNHDMSASFHENSLLRCPVESVIAAVTVKSKLDKHQLFDALSNLATIPQLDPAVLTTGMLTEPFAEYVVSWPSLFVFAFDGIELETCLSHVVNYYNENKVEPNRVPRAIIVNRKYIIAHIHYNAPGKFHRSFLTPDTIGSPLFWVTHELAKGLTWLDGMHVNYGKYYEAAYPRPSQ